MDLLKSYPVFESNQVLTSDHLNSLMEYLDIQDRYSRSKLIGVGIVCGFQIKYVPKNETHTDNTLVISQGVGITSQGFLVSGYECNAHCYRSYKLPETVRYEPFESATTKKQDVELFELLSITKSETTDTDIHELTLEFLEGTESSETNARKVVLLFLEIFDQDLETCLAKSCDEIGQTRIFELRRLLISISDLEKVLERTYDEKFDPSFPGKFPLTEVSVPRILLDPGEFVSVTEDHTTILDKYNEAISSTLNKLNPAIENIYAVYSPILEGLYTNEYTDAIEILTQMAESPVSVGSYAMQYIYDFIKDVTLALTEFNNTAFELSIACNFDKEIFPQHLMLGPAIPQADYNINASKYYNRFIHSPAYTEQKHLLEKTKMLHKRLVSMILSFNKEYLTFPVNSIGETHIIPSFEKLSNLSKRSIPFYYDLNNANLPIAEIWNYDMKKRKLSENILSYHRIADEEDPVKSPVRFDIDKYSFLRIEGIPGKDIESLQNILEEKKAEFNLPFNIIILSLNSSAGSRLLDPSSWNDLQELYTTAANELRCCLQGLQGNMDDIQEQNLLKDYPGYIYDSDHFKNLCNAIPDSLPESIDDFNFDNFFADYCLLLVELHKIKLAFKHYRGILIHELIDVTDPDELHEKLIHIEEVLEIIQKVLDSCIYRELYILFYRLIGRKLYLTENHPAVFSNFLQKHPGMEHTGGVKKGGTLILVCRSLGTVGDHNQVFADFSLPYLCCFEQIQKPDIETELSYSTMPDIAVPDGVMTEIDTPVKIDILRNDYIRNIQNTSVFTDSANAVFNVSERVINYTPNTDAMGFEEFNYSLNQIIDREDEEAQPLNIKAEICPATLMTNAYFGYSIDINETTAIFGALGGRKGIIKSGSAYIYVYRNGQWEMEANLTPDDASNNDQFGFSVAVFGEYAAIGAFGEDTGGSMAGSVYIFRKEDGNWNQIQKLQSLGIQAGDYFGCSVALTADTLVIGSFGKDGTNKNEGCVYIFKLNGGNWEETQILKASDPAEGDYYGYSVAIHGGNLVIGAYCKDIDGFNTGCAYVYSASGDTFSNEQILIATDHQAGDYFGSSVAIHNNNIVIGARREDAAGSNSGSAYVFNLSGESWSEQQKLIPADAEAGDYFGYSVDIFENHIIIGARYEDTGGENIGSAYLFHQEGESWYQIRKFQPLTLNAGDLFGSAVAVYDNIIAIGAHKDDQVNNNAGKVYTFPRDFDLISSNALVTILVRNEYSRHILARDDIQIVSQNEWVNIDVLKNDIIYNTTMIELPNTTTKLGGELFLLTEGAREIQFRPGQSGKDYFEYRLFDNVRDEESIGKVTVFVTKHEERLPDIVYLVRSEGTNIIPVEKAHQEDWQIKETDTISPEIGEVTIDTNKENILFTPEAQFSESNTAGFNYIVEGPDEQHIQGRVSLINGLKDDDYVEYFDNMLAGTIMIFAYNPVEFEEDWMKKIGILECNGQAVLRKDYPRLYKRIGTTYGKGDASKSFNVPDLRGEFIRGWDNGRNVDPKRKFGSWQPDALQAHTHEDMGHTHIDRGHNHREQGAGERRFGIADEMEKAIFGQNLDAEPTEKVIITSPGLADLKNAKALLGDPVDSKNGAGEPRIGLETRPRNVAQIFCIKY